MSQIITFEHRSFRAFEAYGFAMATAGAFEVILRLALAEKQAMKIASLSDARRAIETERYARKLFRASFGSLVQWIKGQYDLHALLVRGLDQAVKSRDQLAHHFWQAHLGNLASDEGVDVIAEECNGTAHFLQEVADEFVRHTGVNLSRYDQFIRDGAALQGHPLASQVDSDATNSDEL